MICIDLGRSTNDDVEEKLQQRLFHASKMHKSQTSIETDGGSWSQSSAKVL